MPSWSRCDANVAGKLRLPEFQRTFVWTRAQILDYLDSLYRKYPVGSILIWKTSHSQIVTRGSDQHHEQLNDYELLLDGQQRISSLYALIHDDTPPFFDGNSGVFDGIYFDVEKEQFRFEKREPEITPLLLDIKSVFRVGPLALEQWVRKVQELDLSDDQRTVYLTTYHGRVSRLCMLPQQDLRVEAFGDKILGSGNQVERVVEIFARLNTRGRRLNEVDIVLAQIVVYWPEVRSELGYYLRRWDELLQLRGGQGTVRSPIDTQLFLRAIATFLSEDPSFDVFRKNDSDTVRKGVQRTAKAIDQVLNLISSRLGLDHSRVILSPFSLPVLCWWLDKANNPSGEEIGRVLAWYLMASVRGWFNKSTDDVIRQCIRALSGGDVSKLEDEFDHWIKQQGHRPRVHEDDFAGSGTRRVGRTLTFYTILYMLSRVTDARDLYTGELLSAHLHGAHSHLQLHHIFPQKFLRDNGVNEDLVDAHANLCFVTAETNKKILNTPPHEYLPKVRHHEGVVQSQWIPESQRLWQVENYIEFLERRRTLLKQATNALLTSLRDGSLFKVPVRDLPHISVDELMDEQLAAVMTIATRLGLSRPVAGLELSGPVDDTSSVYLDLAWPDGLLEGVTEPAAYLLQIDLPARKLLNGSGWKFFLSVDDFRGYAESLESS